MVRLWLLVLALLTALPALAGPGLDGVEGDLVAPPPRPQSGARGEAPPAMRAGTAVVAQNAADWLLTQQQPNGGFPWTAGTTATQINIQGAVARGLLQAWRRTDDPDHLAGALANGDCQITPGCIPGKTFPVSGTPRFGNHDQLYLVELSQLTGNPVYADYLDTHFWSRLTAGTYSDANLDAAGFAAAQLAARTSSGIREMTAWDLSKVAIAAHAVGEMATRDAVFAAILASLEAPDGSSFRTYDVIGLAGAVWAAATTGVALDPQAGAWQDDDSVAELALTLAAQQFPDGSFPGGTTWGVGAGQSTSFALQALHAVDPIAFRPVIEDGFAYLESLQQPGGQFLYYVGAGANDPGGVEVHGETLEAYSIAYLGWRYVSTAGGSDAGDCTEEANPCATIGYAVAQADPYDNIMIAPGTYIQPVTIAKDGLALLAADPANPPVLTRVAGGTNQPLLVVNGARDVKIRNLRFNMDQSFVAEGVLASGMVGGLEVTGNRFVASHTGGPVSTFGMRNAISINVIGNSQGLPRVNGSTVLLENNLVEGVLAAGLPSLRSGISMDAGTGVLRGNDIVASTQDISVRFPTVTGDSTSTEVLVEGNILRGRGLQMASANAGVTAIRIEGNTIEAPTAITDTQALPADWSLLRLIHNPQNIPTSLSGNTFRGHRGNFRGVLLQNYPAVLLDGNLFEPAAGASDFVSLVVSNRELTTDNPPTPPALLALTATGNTFAGSGVAGAGRAVEFINDNDAGGSAAFGALVFGTAGSENEFDDGHRWYFNLRDEVCDTRVPPGDAPQCTFLDYNGVGNLPNTQVRPFHGLVTAAANRFAGALPAEMTAAQRLQLQARTRDGAANPALGQVDYGLSGALSEAFVDDDYAGQPYGTGFLFSHSDPAADGQIVAVGINAFASIGEAAAAVDAGGTVWVAAGEFASGNTVAKRLLLAGTGNGANPAQDTVVTSELSLAASGEPGQPLTVRNLRIASAGGNGVVVAGGRAHWRFEDVHFAGNGNGINFVAGAPGASDIAVTGSAPGACAFTGNTNAIRTSSTTRASDVVIDGCTFQGNGAGIILFGASGSGDGQHLNWRIANSVFEGNDNADATAFGGGIWLKTAGPGSLIDGFEVVDSVFRDNGSANLLNRNGISLRARPGTTLRNVRICDNLFEETAQPGTQAWGILVFDDTGNNGYQPAEVCASNAFNGLQASVSGREQADLRGTWPVVDITGGTIPGTEFLNGFVNRLSDSAKFVTIGAALADPGTLDGETIQAPAGVYAENLVITRNGLTLEGQAGTVVTGAGGPGDGITIATGRQDVTLRDLEVHGYARYCVFGQSGNDRLRVEGLHVHHCGNHGIYVNGVGGISDVTLHGNQLHHVGGRGLVVWNGAKRDITISDNIVTGPIAATAIAFEDGTARGVQVTGNSIDNSLGGDAGIVVMQPTGGSPSGRPNLIAGNTIVDPGRFGIVLLIPNGTGEDSGDGAIVVEDNEVTGGPNQGGFPVFAYDRAGIQVIRGYLGAASQGQVDDTRGVVIRDNEVTGFALPGGAPAGREGYGIVVEGLTSSVHDNTVSGNDIGIQLQAGNPSGLPPGNANFNALTDFFDRGNAPSTCVAVSENTLSANGVDFRMVSEPAGQHLSAIARNQRTGVEYCSIQAAIDEALEADQIVVAPGVHRENLVIATPFLGLAGPFAGVPGTDPARGTGEAVIAPLAGRALLIHADNVIVDGLEFSGLDGQPTSMAIGSGLNFGGEGDNVTVRHSRFVNLNGSAIYTNGPNNLRGWTVHENLVDGIVGPAFSGINLWKMEQAAIHHNVVRNTGFAGIQLNGGADLEVWANVVEDTGANGINIGPNLAGGIRVHGNTVTGANTSGSAGEAAIILYGQSSGVDLYCNTLDPGLAGNGTIAASDAFGALGSDIAIYHNALLGTASIDNANTSSTLTLGSNWYAAGSPSTSGDVVLADALAGNPVGQALCGDLTPATVAVESGSPQSAEVGTAFAAPLVVVVRDGLGGTVPGTPVAWTSPSAPGASLVPASSDTDFNGRAQVTASADPVAGSYQVSANSSLSPVAVPALFDLTNLAGAAASVVVVSGSGQETQVATAFPAPLVVQVRDAQDNPVADGTAVVFTATAAGNGASLALSPVATTTTGGLASVVVDANTVAGAYTVTAASGSGSAGFALANLPGPAAAVAIASGDGQSAEVGSAFAQPLVVSVEDAHGNLVADGTEVGFASLPGGNGAAIQEVSPIAATTTDGLAQASVSANLVAGSHQVTASAGSGSASFTLDNLAGAAVAIVQVSGDGQTGNLGEAFALPLVVRVDDIHGNPVPGQAVQFSAPAAGAGASFPVNPVVTDGNGLASATVVANGLPGPYGVVATLAGVGEVGFSLTNQLAIEFAVTGPVSAELGLPVVYQASLRNNGPALPENVLVAVSVTRAGGIAVGDLDGTEISLDDGATWLPVPLAAGGNDDLVAEFPGPAGVPVGAGAEATVLLRGRFMVADAYAASFELVGAGGGDYYAGDTLLTTVVNSDSDVLLSLSGPGIASVVGTTAGYEARLRNAGGATTENLRVDFAIARSGGIVAGDLLVEYETAPGSGVWQPIALSPCGPLLCGVFGPGAGFPVAAGYDASTALRTSYQRSGSYTVSALAVGMVSGDTYASDALSVEVDVGVTLDLAGALVSEVGVATDYQARLRNSGQALAENVIGRLRIERAGIVPADVALSYDAGGGTFLPLPTTACDADTLCASFGPGTGFPVAAGYDATTAFRAVFEAEGTYTATVAIEGIVSGNTYASAMLAGTVLRSEANLALTLSGPGTAALGVAAPSSARILNAGGALDENAVVEFVVSRAGGLADGDIDIAYETAPGSGVFLSLMLVPCGPDLCGTFGPGAGFPVAAGYDATTALSTTFLRSGTFQVAAAVVGIDTDTVYADASRTVVVGVEPVTVGNIRFAANDAATIVFDGSPRAIAFDASPAAGTLGIACAVSVDGGPALPVAAGSYAVEVACAGPDHAGSGQAILVVEPAPATLSLTGLAQVYDGTPRVVGVEPAGVAVAVTYDGDPSAPVDAGSYAVTATVVDPNYTGAPVSGTLVVSPATATLAFADLNQVYDGTPRLASFSTAPAGLAGVSLSYAPADPPVAAGSYTVTASLANPNYVFAATPSATLVVAPANAAVTLSGLSAVYDGTPKAVSASTVPAGLAVTVTYAGDPQAPVNAGSYAVVATVDDANYVGGASAQLVIAQAPATVALSGLVQSFDGTPRPVTVATTPAGLPVTVTYDGLPAAPSAIGSYAVAAVVSDGNHVGAAAATLQIVAAEPEVLELTVNGGASASAEVGTAAAYSLQARVLDAFGNPVPGISVAFAGPAGGAGTTPASATVATNAAGEANVVFDANLVAGSFQVVAGSAGLEPASVSLENLAAAAATLLPVAGDGQSAAVGEAFAMPLQVRAEDVHGNPVAGVEVAFSAPAGGAGAVLDPASGLVTTGADGLAQVQATANATAGTYQVLADAGLGTPVAFGLTNLPAAPALLVKVAGDGQSAPVGGTVAVAPQVRVEDAQGNPVEGAVVSFTAGPGGGSVSGATAVTGADGLAAVGAWTLGGEGGHVLDAALPGAPSVAAVQFTATAVASIDVGVTVTSTSGFIRVGDLHDHLVLVANHGNGALTGVRVEVSPPDGHAAATAQWLCVPAGGASCGATSAGSGPVDILVDLPVGASVILLTAAEVIGNPTEEIVKEATVTAAGDAVPGNDSDQAVTPVVLFRDGFEPGGDGASGEWLPAGELAPDGAAMVVPLAARTGDVLPAAWLQGLDGAGRLAFSVDRVTLAGRTWLRASAGAPGAWVPAEAAVGLALLDAGAGALLVMDGGARQVELPLAGRLAGPLAVRVVAD